MTAALVKVCFHSNKTQTKISILGASEFASSSMILLHSQRNVPGAAQSHMITIGASVLAAESVTCTCAPIQITLEHLTCNVNHVAASALESRIP